MPTINDRLSDAAIRLGRYEGPGGFSVWRDDSPDGVVLIGIVWEESAEDGTKQESWDAYGSVHWPVGRMATGYDLASARMQALDMLARNGVLGTDADANLRGWRESGEHMPIVASARAFLPELVI